MIRAIPTVAVKDQATERALGHIISAVGDIALKEILDGELLKDVVIVAGTPKLVAHKLGRKPVGYLVVRRSANSMVWDSAATKEFLTLSASANVTVSLWVF